MKCPNCGSYIPEGMLICPDCRQEIQMVPDYNPLEDVLAEEVKGAVHGATRPIQTEDLRRYHSPRQDTNHNSTRVLQPEEIALARRQKQQTETARRPRVGANQAELEERKRAHALRLKKAKQRRTLVVLILLFSLLSLSLLIFFMYRNSYEGLMNRGNQAFITGAYDQAFTLFERAVERNVTRPDAYVGMSNVLLAQNDLEGAERIFLNALDLQPTNLEIYQALIDFYITTDQHERISILLRDVTNTRILTALAEYISMPPDFSLPEGMYSEVQQLTLIAEGSRIFYTTDGSDPTMNSTLFSEPILIGEGETVIKAFAVNEMGVPSSMITRTYIIELPLASPPAVSPSTGQYEVETMITIQVPDGYSAFYTLDGTIPTSSSNLYEGPIAMPEGTTKFAAVLRNNNNMRYSGVTNRVYVLNLNQGE